MVDKSLRFFFFGCWNNGGCSNNQNLSNVISTIAANKHLYDFGVILGDNIYNEGKSQFHNIETLKNGIECVNKINLPLYVVLGEHDITQCDIIKEQSKKHDNWIFEGNYYATEFEKSSIKLKLIVIDTNLLADPKIYTKVEECLLPENIKTNRQEMLNFLRNELTTASHYDWVIVAGHCPPASFKHKDNKSQLIVKPYANELLEILGDVPNLLYICAGTHNFQYNTVSSVDRRFFMREIISGTGGAEPDLIVPVFRIGGAQSAEGLLDTEMHDTHEPYGYCEMTISANKIYLIYHKIMPFFQQHLYLINKSEMEQKGGEYYFNKYLKYKTKYKQLSKII